jgi:hypothetical protein
LSLRPPSAVVGDRAVPAVWRDADSLYVFTEEGQKVEIKPALGRDPIVFERRRNGVADWVLYEYSLEATQRVDIRITHRGETVLKEQR